MHVVHLSSSVCIRTVGMHTGSTSAGTFAIRRPRVLVELARGSPISAEAAVFGRFCFHGVVRRSLG